jgi:hypothetical protein
MEPAVKKIIPEFQRNQADARYLATRSVPAQEDEAW